MIVEKIIAEVKREIEEIEAAMFECDRMEEIEAMAMEIGRKISRRIMAEMVKKRVEVGGRGYRGSYIECE